MKQAHANWTEPAVPNESFFSKLKGMVTAAVSSPQQKEKSAIPASAAPVEKQTGVITQIMDGAPPVATDSDVDDIWGEPFEDAVAGPLEAMQKDEVA